MSFYVSPFFYAKEGISIMRKWYVFFMILIVALGLNGCSNHETSGNADIMTQTSTVDNIYINKCENISNNPNAKSQKLFSKHVQLPNGLTLEEYDDIPIWPHQENRGCYFLPARHLQPDSQGKIVLNDSIFIKLTPLKNSEEYVEVIKNEQVVYNVVVKSYVYSGLLSSWSFSDHWCIEVIHTSARVIIDDIVINAGELFSKQQNIRKHIDIICDGKSMKNFFGYDEVFTLQTINNEPFFLFAQNGKYGANYKSVGSILEYDSLPWIYPHPGLEIPVRQFENMIILIKQDKLIILSNFD